MRKCRSVTGCSKRSTSRAITYDRIVYFSFGLLIACPIHAWLLRVTAVRRGWS
jgi:hypothetical protein